MNIRQVAFADVFNGKLNYGPQAIVNVPLAAVVQRFDLKVETGEDGLDRFEAVPMVLIGKGGHIPFALWRHAHNPPDTFAIHMPIYVDNRRPLALILRALGLPKEAVLWEAPSHEVA